MSHFTVLVQLSALALSNHNNDVDQALADALAPFEESPKDDSPFLVFESEDETWRKEYDTEKTMMVRAPDGKLRFEHDKIYQVSKKPGDFFAGTETVIPEGHAKVEVGWPEVYGTYAKYVKDYHGGQYDKSTREWGFFRNPNKKWDWFTIGGRWRGHFPVKPGTEARVGEPGAFDNKAEPGGADVVRVSDIDFDRAAVQEREAFEKFKVEYREMLGGKKYGPFDGPRDSAMRLGLVRVVQGPYPEPKANEVVMPWKDLVNDDRASWNDVCLRFDDEALAVCSPFFSPLRTYAALDKDGAWHAPGDMGWFGCSSDTPDQNLGFSATFVEKFIRSAGPNDLLVLVDCHI